MPAGPAAPRCRSQPCQPAPEICIFCFFSKDMHVIMCAAHSHELQPVSKYKYPANSILINQAASGMVRRAGKSQTDQHIGTYNQTICNDCSVEACLSCSGAPDVWTAVTPNWLSRLITNTSHPCIHSSQTHITHTHHNCSVYQSAPPNLSANRSAGAVVVVLWFPGLSFRVWVES